MQLLNFKQWICESADFPESTDLASFIEHAITVCIRTHQEMFAQAHSQKQKDLMNEIIALSELLQHIQKSMEEQIPFEPINTDKFQGRPAISLTKNQLQHKYPKLPSVLQVLRTIGGNPAIDKPTSQALSDRIESLFRAWKSALQQT